MTFFNDLFNEASNTALASHTPDLGGTWVKHPNFAGTATVNAANDWAIGDSTSSALYYNNVTPPSADYSVSAPIQINTTTTPNTGVMGRISSSASTMYMFYTTGAAWVLAKLVGGTNTDLLNVPFTPTLNTDYTLELSMVGNTISAKVNGSHITGSPVTDSSITAAGHPGARVRSGGSLKEITAVNLGAAPDASFSTSATTALPTFSGSAHVSPVTSFAVTPGLPVFSGSASSGDASFSFAVTTAPPAFSGSATGDTSTATITITDLRDLTTGTLRTNETGITALINNVTTGDLVAKLTGQTSTSGGDMVLSHASLVAATQYRVTIILGDGSEGTWKYTAA